MDVLLGRIESYRENGRYSYGEIEGLCTCPKCRSWPNLYEMEDSGERMYYVQCPTCKDNYSEDSSIEDALDSWVSTADDLAQKMCEDAEMDVESELTPGNTEIQFRYDPEPLPYGRWTFTVQFEDMGTIWEDDTEYSTLEELKSFHENFNKWCLTYFGGTNTVQENAMKWLLNLFKANK